MIGDSDLRGMKQKKQPSRRTPASRPTLRYALIVTAISLICLGLDVLLSFAAEGIWPGVGGILGIVGIIGLAQALAMALFARRGSIS
jgi:hypothetical protein